MGLMAQVDRARSTLQSANEQLSEARELLGLPKQEAPKEPEEKGFFDKLKDKVKNVSLSDIGHTVLDVAGLVPVIGAPADGINAAWYLAEGDKTNAALSAVGMIPFAGEAATATKLGVKATNAAIDAARAADKAADAAKGTKKTFITYTLRGGDENGAVRYVGRASGRGTPEQVMEQRLSKGHKIFKAHPELKPRIEAIQGNRSANHGAEDVFYEYHKREGADLYNNPKSPPLSNLPLKIAKSRKRITDYAEDLKTDW